MSGFFNRVVRAMRLDAGLYEEVEHNPRLTGQAATVVVLASLASGIGAGAAHGIGSLIWGVVGSLAGWLVWAFLTYLIGTRLLETTTTQADLGQLLRTLGFAYSPALLNILGVIPFLGWVVRAAVFFWVIATWVVAVRQALDYDSTARAVGVAAIGWLAYVIIMGVLMWLLGIRTPVA